MESLQWICFRSGLRWLRCTSSDTRMWCDGWLDILLFVAVGTWEEQILANEWTFNFNWKKRRMQLMLLTSLVIVSSSSHHQTHHQTQIAYSCDGFFFLLFFLCLFVLFSSFARTLIIYKNKILEMLRNAHIHTRQATVQPFSADEPKKKERMKNKKKQKRKSNLPKMFWVHFKWWFFFLLFLLHAPMKELSNGRMEERERTKFISHNEATAQQNKRMGKEENDEERRRWQQM